MEQRDADHRENSQNLFFWDELFFVFPDDVAKTLIALFHDNAGEIIWVFDKIDHSHDHRVVDSSQETDFSFGCPYYLAILIFRSNMVLKSLCCVDFSVDFRLDFEDNCLPSFFDNFDRVIVVVRSAKSG